MLIPNLKKKKKEYQENLNFYVGPSERKKIQDILVALTPGTSRGADSGSLNPLCTFDYNLGPKFINLGKLAQEQNPLREHWHVYIMICIEKRTCENECQYKCSRYIA